MDGTGAANPIRYTGREMDETGLYYYRARYYSPQMGRFISEDPIRFAGGMNFYSYVGNNPVNYVDPEGEYAGWIIATAVVAGAAYIWYDLIYPTLHPDLSHEPQPHLECMPAHPVDPRTLRPQRIPVQTRETPRTRGR